eukprot:TRINITY_DN20476_c0_g1_i1.p1 TRINITY_DN20476_c0_g1~~TRINITY_DN20476_c0_g1_i1.p1  ORF type:complete len:599 (+),score=109.66 TRINITY_DN20476_c0_g1_i1:287-2083(+)
MASPSMSHVVNFHLMTLDASLSPSNSHHTFQGGCRASLPSSLSTIPIRIASYSFKDRRISITTRRKFSGGAHHRAHVAVATASTAAPVAEPSSSPTSSIAQSEEAEVLAQLARIIDPDFGTDIVSCGFIKDMQIDAGEGVVAFQIELTTPACPVKDEFERQAQANVSSLPWVKEVRITMSAQPPKPLLPANTPPGLAKVANIIAVSSCKGGVGKSTTAVNLAYALLGMGARVGIFDADVYGPSLPTMVSPEVKVLQMDPDTRQIQPTEFLGVKLVSFGFAGQGSAIMRGPMVAGVIQQLLTTTDWGTLDYLVVDFPPGTGDIQLTLCQVVPITAAVIVTTPQKLAFIDVAKGVRMFSKLKVPCVAVVENMCYFEGDDGKRYFPFGQGSGAEVVQQFGIPNLFQMPIRPELSASGDSGEPEVVAHPDGEVAAIFSSIGATVVQQCAKIRQQVSTAVSYDKERKVIRVNVPGTEEEFFLHPATVRRNDRSAQSIDEWSGEQKLRYSDIADSIEPETIRPLGNYAAEIVWPDGFAQIAPFDQLQELERMVDVAPLPASSSSSTPPSAVPNEPTSSSKPLSDSGAEAIMELARSLKASSTQA